MKTKIYFETGSLDRLHKVHYELQDAIYVASCRSGYRAMINDVRTAIKNKRNIYTNEVSIIGSNDLWGKVFMHEIWVRDTDSKEWYRINPNLIERLGKPELIEAYIKKYICVDKKERRL